MAKEIWLIAHVVRAAQRCAALLFEGDCLSLGSAADGGAGSWYFGTNNSTGQLQFGVGATDYQGATGAIVPLNTWCHIAWVRNGSTWTSYLNGGSPASTSLSVDANGAGAINIGRGRAGSSNYFAGYISNLRLLIGTALYTTSFTAPSSPLDAITNTKLLVGKTFTSGPIVDESGNNWTLTKSGGSTGQLAGLSIFNPFTGLSRRVINANDLSFISTFTSSFIKANSGTTKTLLIDTTDALTNPNIANPEQAFSAESSG